MSEHQFIPDSPSRLDYCRTCGRHQMAIEHVAAPDAADRLTLAEALDRAERLGAEKDTPEGVRYVQLSDTLAHHIADALRAARRSGEARPSAPASEGSDRLTTLLDAADKIAGADMHTWGVDESKVDYHGPLGKHWLIRHLADALRAAHREARTPDLTAFDFRAHLQRQREFSERTFGPGVRTKGVVDHIRKELREIEAKPDDLSEWIDVAILALDGAWRMGATPDQIITALVAKQDRNERREWPDWRKQSPDKAIEHVRAAGGAERTPPDPTE